MSIDLSKYAQDVQAVVPVIDNKFVYKYKKYKTKPVVDGWHKVEILGNKVEIIDEDTIVSYKTVSGFTYNNMFVWQNFDVAKRRGRGISEKLEFNNAETFTPVKAVAWEDNRIYYTDVSYSEFLVYQAKDAFEAEQPLPDKYITPEVRALYLFHTIERDNVRAEIALQKELAAEAEAEKERERRKNDIPYRLQDSFGKAGAELLNYSLSRGRIIVDWKLPGSSYTYNTVIDQHTWMVVEAGYCMSGDDRRHNITSVVKTAEIYEGDGLIYKTRS